MPTSPLKRARSDAQKQERRQEILEFAAMHFHDVGFEKFSMAGLARLCGMAKGTLYLYFATREEVLLELCLTKLEAWRDRFIADCSNWQSDEAFALSYFNTTTIDNDLMQVFSRLDDVIEHNVSLEQLIGAKRHILQLIANIANEMTERLSLSEAQAIDATRSLAALLMGSVRGDMGPVLEKSTLPEDIQVHMDQFGSKKMFTKNACRILAGIRAGQ